MLRVIYCTHMSHINLLQTLGIDDWQIQSKSGQLVVCGVKG